MTEQNTNQNPDALEVLMVETAEKLAVKRAEESKVAKGSNVSYDQLGELFALQMTKIDAQIAKAVADREEQSADREEPVSKAVGRKGTVAGTQTAKGLRDENPLQYIVSKARAEGEKPAYTTYDTTDKALIWALTRKALANGMVNEATDDEQEVDLDNL